MPVESRNGLRKCLGIDGVNQQRVINCWRERLGEMHCGNRGAVHYALRTLVVAGIPVLGNGRPLMELPEAEVFDSLQLFGMVNATFGYTLGFLMRWKMFEPALKGSLDLKDVVLSEGTNGRAREVRRPAVARALMVDGAPYIDAGGKTGEELAVEYVELETHSRELLAGLGGDFSAGQEKWRNLAETNRQMGRLALLLGKDWGYAVSADFEGSGYYEAAKIEIAAGGLDCADPWFLQAREARLRAARVCFLLAEEEFDPAKALRFSRHLARHLSLVGTIEMTRQHFGEGIGLKLLVLQDLMARYETTRDPGYLEIMEERLAQVAADYGRDGNYLESARASETRADALLYLGQRYKAAQVLWKAATRLQENLGNLPTDDGARDAAARVIDEYLRKVEELFLAEGRNDLAAKARAQLESVQQPTL